MNHVLEPAWKHDHERRGRLDDVPAIEGVLLDVDHVDPAARVEQLQFAVIVGRWFGFPTVDVVDPRPHTVGMIVYAVVAAVAEHVGPTDGSESEGSRVSRGSGDQARQLDG